MFILVTYSCFVNTVIFVWSLLDFEVGHDGKKNCRRFATVLHDL